MSAQKKGGTVDVLKLAWSAKSLWLVHLAGNAVLLALAYAWLWVPEAKFWQLAISALLALTIAVATLWLHGATVSHFHGRHHAREASLAQALRDVAPRIPALLVWSVLLGLALWLLVWVEEQTQLWAAAAASWLTLKLQKPVSPDSIFRAYAGLLWVLRWMVVPLVLLPVAAHASLTGFEALRWKCMRRGWRTFQRGGAWLLYLGVLLFGRLMPEWITSWVPAVSGMFAETASMVVRFGVAYVLAVVSWLILLSLLAKSGGENGEPIGAREPAGVTLPAAHSSPGAGSE